MSEDDEYLEADYFSTGDSDFEDGTPDFESMWSLPSEDDEEENSAKMRALVTKLKMIFLRIANRLSFGT